MIISNPRNDQRYNQTWARAVIRDGTREVHRALLGVSGTMYDWRLMALRRALIFC